MIKFNIRGENLEVTEALRSYVEEKVAKIEKYFNTDQELTAKVNLKVYREKTSKVEVTIPLGSITLRAEDVSQDMYGSIDLVVDKIERQIRRNKTKIEKKNRQKVPTGQIFTEELVEQVEEEVKVVRTKQVDLKPMDIEEAKLQLDLLGHDFFIYTDAKDNTTNVLYKREDGDLGLLEVK
ncbi:ribosome hibernation-promoting factor, HPF/YfiA family [Streptococcus cameli]